MARNYLGELEQVVLLALMRLGDDAYGVSIRREIEVCTGRSLTPGTIYPTLERLERKGLVRSHLGEATPERGGRAKRYYVLEDQGVAAVQRSRRMLAALSKGIEARLDPKGGKA